MAAGRTLKTLSNLIARSGNVVKTASITTSNPLFSRNIKALPYFQTIAAYRAAVLHEIAKPLIIEDVTTTTKLKDLEVGHAKRLDNIKCLLFYESLFSFADSDRSLHLWS